MKMYLRLFRTPSLCLALKSSLTCTCAVKGKSKKRKRWSLCYRHRRSLNRVVFGVQEAPLGGGGRQRRTLPSVVERSTAGGLHSTGPLSVLFRAVRDRLRVKVWTRSHTRVRSILTAFVQAYDRHVNLALADVDEVLLLPEDRPPPTQPAPEAAEPRAPPADPLVLRLPSWTPGWTDTAPPESPVGCPTTASSGSCPPPGRSLRKTTACIPLEPTGAGPPLGDPRRRRRKKRTGRRRPAPPLLAARARHVGQLFVRGDNVVSVALLPV
ncbi:uncharacterized protein LOC144128554 isoform X2 [Amblyomma americanum]